jgi:formylglycine-generating enzyme required for sulfatase activity
MGVVFLMIIVLAMTGKLNSIIYRPIDMEDYWVAIPAGEFQMGGSPQTSLSECQKYYSDCNINDSDDSAPVHSIMLDTFEIGRFEVTNKQFTQCVNAGICTGMSDVDVDRLLHPVTNITWHEAITYCKWVGGRLPTEAEWEKAARGTDGRVYTWGNDLVNSNLANYGNNVGDTSKVGSYPSGVSPYGIYDMAGNVWEWVMDWHSNTYYQNSPKSNPLGPDTGTNRVLRGGAWSGNEIGVISFSRHGYLPLDTYINIGFRCARDVMP